MSGAAGELPATPTADPSWLLVEEGFTLAREHEIESIFTVSNGYVGTRASLAEGSSLSSPATFVAGAFAVNPEADSIPELIVVPDWTRLRVSLNGQALRLEEGEVLEHRRVLDLQQAIFWREWRQRDAAGRVMRLRLMRLASLADRHILLQSVTITPGNYSGRIVLETRIERPEERMEGQPPMSPEIVPVPPDRLPAIRAPSMPSMAVVELRAAGDAPTIALASAGELRTEEGRRIEQKIERGEGWVAERWDWDADIGVTYRLDRLVSIYTSRDTAQPVDMAARHLEHVWGEGIENVVQAHTKAWNLQWQRADVQVKGDEEAQRALRFACYTLISASDPEDDQVSIGARAFTGEGYKGHVFWDTEIYMLPFYIYTYPSSARSLLMYRYHTLSAAREKARSLGYRGALYAWESAGRGQETTPSYVVAPHGEVIQIRNGEQENHISADVAYAIYHYWRATADDEFLVDAGAEIILETARFWASRGQMEADGRYHIRGVIGPDEYHVSINDSAYTNVMAQWNLERGAEMARLLAERWPARWQEMAERLEIDGQEPQEWLRLAAAMYTGFDPRTGLFEQFIGYFDLEDIDLAAYEPHMVPMDVLLGRERIERSKVIKQADVVLLIYLLWDRFPPEVREANFRYYEPRTGHGSSLSPAIHALVAARLGDMSLAERYFRQAAEIDLADNMGNAASGVHMGALGGLWQAAICGYAGMGLYQEGLGLDSHLPPDWHRLCFQCQWRSRSLLVRMVDQPATIEAQPEGDGGIPATLVNGPTAVLIPGHSYIARRGDSGWGAWQEMPAADPYSVQSNKGDSYEPEIK